jgi:hypothetical protein
MPEQIRPGLWRWSAPHPAWRPGAEPGTPDDWPRDVGAVLYQTRSRAVFFDPLAPAADPAFWGWADQRCDGREVSVLETIPYHRRDRDQFIAHYGAGAGVPDVVVAHRLPAGFEETLYWIPEHRALIPGDALLGAGGGELRLCPDSWLAEQPAKPTAGELREALGVLVGGLDVELVLVSHGEPALHDGAAALARALRAT